MRETRTVEPPSELVPALLTSASRRSRPKVSRSRAGNEAARAGKAAVRAVSSGSAADAFLGTQGDPWDTQSDMAFAGLGAVLSLLICRRFHDRQLRKFSSL